MAESDPNSKTLVPDATPLEPRKPEDSLFKVWANRLRDQGLRYWVTMLVVLVLTTLGSSFVYEKLKLEDARSYLFQRLLQSGLHPAEPRLVKLVLIEDDDYWLGELAGRRPIKRTYLAELVDKLVSMNVHVIALDFDVRLPNPISMNTPADYQSETMALINSIKSAATQGKKIVLGTPISGADRGNYLHDTDIYQANGLCVDNKSADSDKDNVPTDLLKTNIACGYISLPKDPLAIPPPLPLVDGTVLDPLSLVIAKAENPPLIDRLLKRTGTGIRYLDFISPAMFIESKSVFSARAVRQGMVDKSNLDSKIVIVGANWHRDAAERGPVVDQQVTPAGLMIGAELHANFAEAFLDSRIFSAAPKDMLEVCEVLFSIFAAIVFALIHSIWGRLLGILSLLAFAFLATSVGLLVFGVFFDVFVPLVGLGLHSLFETFFGHFENNATNSVTI